LFPGISSQNDPGVLQDGVGESFSAGPVLAGRFSVFNGIYPILVKEDRGSLMRVIDMIAQGAGAVVGAILGYLGFVKLYLPLKMNLGLGMAGPGSGGEGPIVPAGHILPFYLMAGGAIDLIVLLAFIIAGASIILGILRSMRENK
jgi:hypothetical protein